LIVLLEPLLVPVWVALIWGERPAWWTIAGGSLILLGLVSRYLRPLVHRAI
jgi:drug/metabolite transporter (DMT)-like permease